MYMRNCKHLFFLMISLLLLSCRQTTDCGNTMTQVNKCMTPFDDEGKAVIFSATGEGQIENFFFAGDDGNWHHPGQFVLNVYCDDQLCLSGKLYELACLNMDYLSEESYRSIFLETPLFCKFGSRNSINLNFKIPYYHSCRVELVQPQPGVKDQVWTTVRANDRVCISYGGRTLPKGAYFRGIRRGDETIASGEQHTLLESSQNTMLVGVNFFLNSTVETSMEACLRAFDTRDGSVEYLSSGLEDFFLGTYYFDSGQFMRYHTGQTCLLRENGGVKLAAYRQFTENPICFNHPVKITVRNGDNNEINQDSELTPDVAFGSGSANMGSFCFYYEWE